jgi:ribosomal protein S12 methylthiotransferase
LYKNQISKKEKERRFGRLMSAQKDISRKINQGLIGKVLKVLLEEKGKDYYIARTEYDAPEIDGLVYINGKNLKIGNFYNIRITDACEYDLVGNYESGK